MLIYKKNYKNISKSLFLKPMVNLFYVYIMHPDNSLVRWQGEFHDGVSDSLALFLLQVVLVFYLKSKMGTFRFSEGGGT